MRVRSEYKGQRCCIKELTHSCTCRALRAYSQVPPYAQGAVYEGQEGGVVTYD